MRSKISSLFSSAVTPSIPVGTKAAGEEFLHTGSIAVEDHCLEGANTVIKGDKDEFVILNGESVGICHALVRRNRVSFEEIFAQGRGSCR